MWTAMQVSNGGALQCAIEGDHSAQAQLGARCRSTCGVCQAKGQQKGRCASVHLRRTHFTFLLQIWGARSNPHWAVLCTLRRLIEQAGGLRTRSDMFQSSTTGSGRSGVMDVVSWFFGRSSAATLGSTSACVARLQNVATRVAASAGEVENAETGARLRI